jgi:murein DD-endopeptidase MepM/ murein hydrolase activator NlpD
MHRSLLVLVSSIGLLATSAIAPLAAHAAPAPGTRACPTEDFWVGAGWGADRGKRQHLGIDLGGRRGTPIYAIEDGVIDRTKLQSNGALQIVMRGRSGSKFYYGHMDKVLIKGGQRVEAGEVIGLMGDTGSPGAVHLHFEYWRSGGESAAVDPEELIYSVCRIGKDGKGDSMGPNPRPAPAPDLQPAAKPDAAAKPDPAPVPGDIAGEVFTN